MAKKQRQMFYTEEELTTSLIAESQTLVHTLTERRGWAWEKPEVVEVDYAHHEPGMTACRITVCAAVDMLSSGLSVDGLGAAKRCFSLDRRDSAEAGRAWAAQRAIATAYQRWADAVLRAQNEEG